MRQDQRETLRQRFQFRCGYCGVSERDAGAELTVDHFQPGSRGGRHESANWVYCCHACNEFKGDFWQPESTERILHPVDDDLSVHVVEQEDGTLVGLTSTGAFHVARLHLNRRPLVEYRRERQRLQAAQDLRALLLARLRELENEVHSLTAQLKELDQSGQT
jgi:hypothetical protein